MSKNSDFPSLDDICTLIQQTYQQDEIGQSIPTENSREVFCCEIAVFAGEYSKAGLQGIKPSIGVILQKEEYKGETLLEYKGQRYALYRTFPREELIELYCEVRIGEYLN